MKLCFIDTETTGFNFHNCALLQLAGCIEENGVILEKFNFKMKPARENYVWEPGASEATGFTESTIQQFEDPGVCFKMFTEILNKYGNPYAKRGDEKLMPVGYNVNFDTDFLIQWFRDMATTENDKKYANGYFGFFYVPGFDVIQLANLKFFETRQTFKKFNLEATCKAAGLQFNPEEAHDALYDVKKTRELFHTLTDKKYYKRGQ